MSHSLDDHRPRESEAEDARSATVERAIKTWTGELVDLTARNNLLFYRDLKVGTLDLGNAEHNAVFDALTGKAVTLARLFDQEDERADAVKRARTVHNRAREHFEERGLETLFLACGMATWTNQRTASVPAAPVLLVPARLA